MTSAASRLEVQNFIAGEWSAGSSGDVIDVIDPATETVVSRFTSSAPGDVDRAVAAARAAQPGWAALTAGERSQLLHQVVDRVAAALGTLIDVEVCDAGKPVTAARTEEFPAIVDAMRHFAGAARTMVAQPAGEYVSGTTTLLRREPVGVVAGITPWNYPLWQAVWKVFPALAAGNTVVLKPAENTPLSTTHFVALAAEVLPAGVLNLVHGYGHTTGDYLSHHPGVDMVSFTGSVATGRAIARAAAGRPSRTVLELGGNAPVIVHDDADVAAAARTVVQAGLYNAGQECQAATRVIVAEPVADEFLAQLLDGVSEVVIGDTTDEKTTLGPLISARQLARVEEMLARRPEKAKVVAGGRRANRPGFYLEPTVVTGLAQDDELVQEEIFAPVITVQRFADEDEALAMANGVRFGLAASVWTLNVQRAFRFANQLNFGNVWVNTHLVVGCDFPIGGFNESGYGKEGGIAGIEEFTRLKQVGIKLA
jgi:betaine-aldehyde dehydrogenase